MKKYLVVKKGHYIIDLYGDYAPRVTTFSNIYNNEEDARKELKRLSEDWESRHGDYIRSWTYGNFRKVVYESKYDVPVTVYEIVELDEG